MANPLRIGSWKVNLVDDRQDFQIRIQGQVDIGQGLGFDSLGRVHHQNGPFTGCQRTGYLIGKVNVPRGVNQVENIGFPILGLVVELNGIELDGNPTLPLQVHTIQELGLHFPAGYRLRLLQNPISKGRFPMVNMGNNGEVPNLLLAFF